MTTTAAPPTTARSHFFDNAKLILIVIVALGHFVEPFAYTHTSTTLSALWFSIYLFHMPAFIFVSGMFAKGLVDKRPFQTAKWLRNVVLYVALVVAIFLDTRYLLGQKGFTLSFFRQGGLPWYLLAIVIYPIVMVALKQIRTAPLLVGSVVLALLAGLDNSINDTLALSRVIVYAPFYIAGYCLPIAATERFVRATKLKYAALAVSAATVVVVFTQLDHLRPYMPLLSARRGYEAAGVSNTSGLIARAIILALAVVLGFTMLAFTPARFSLFRGAGARTLQIYVLHYFVRDYLVHRGVPGWLQHHLPTWWIPLWLALAVVTVAVVSSRLLSWTVSWSDRLTFRPLVRRDQTV